MMLGAFAETSAAAAPHRIAAAKAFFVLSITSNSMEFRTGSVKGPIKPEYGSIKKVEVQTSTFRHNSMVLVWFFAASHSVSAFLRQFQLATHG
jgi:hypothetical protein